MVKKADEEFHALVAKTKEQMGDVLHDDGEEGDDEPRPARVRNFF